MVMVATKVGLEIVPTGDLKVDTAYQRPLDERRVQRMGEHWDDALAGALTVSRRNGSWYVVDGQQRLAAARIAGVRTLPALVHIDLSPAEEAGLFVGLNTELRRPSFFALYRARLEQGDEEVRAVDDALHVRGLAPTDHQPRRPNEVRSLAVLLRIERTSHRLTGSVLDTIIEAWPEDSKRWEATLISGVASFIHCYQGHR